uniref:Coiled-coil domain containing 167 n=1 Tax=Bursaphelenchus xylophilus TaxID=6326 RepID=A0A1I7SS21_BURXY
MARLENMEEELLRTKKSHSFAMREISIMRTRLKVLEKECKKKDQQIDELMKDEVSITSRGKKSWDFSATLHCA